MRVTDASRLAAALARERQQHEAEISALEMQIKVSLRLAPLETLLTIIPSQQKLKKDLKDVVEHYHKTVNIPPNQPTL